MADTKQAARIVSPTEGSAISLMGDSYRIIIPGEVTNNDYAVIDMLVPPGGGPGPHAHKDMSESFYVMEGEVEFATEDGIYTATRGTTVTIPKGGLVHAFKNKSNKPAHLLCTVSPAGLERFFEEIGEPGKFGTFLPPPHLDEKRIAKQKEVAERYGQEIYPPDYLGKVTRQLK